MRIPIGLCIVLTLVALAQPATKPGKPGKTAASPALPKLGIKTPGVQIPYASLKSEAEFMGGLRQILAALQMQILYRGAKPSTDPGGVSKGLPSYR